ncbi:MAG: hypothetical protein WCH01_02120 [Methylococcaceae bacterium]
MTNTSALTAYFPALMTGFLVFENIHAACEDCWVYGYDNSRRHVLAQVGRFLTHMNKLIEFSPDNRYIKVEPGMTN